MEINLTVVIKSKLEFRKQLKVILENLVENYEKELAYMQCDLHQNINNSIFFIFHGVWKDKE